MTKLLTILSILILAGCGRPSPETNSMDAEVGEGALSKEKSHTGVIAEPAASPNVEESPPIINSASLLELEYGKPFSYQITADHAPIGFAVTHQPPWLQRQGPNLSGHPSQIGEFNVELRAFNHKGSSEPFKLKIIVKPKTQTD